MQGLGGIGLASLLSATYFTDSDVLLLKHLDQLFDEKEGATQGRAHLVRNSCCEGLRLACYVQLLVYMLVYDLSANLLCYVRDLYRKSRHSHVPLVPYFESVELAFW